MKHLGDITRISGYEVDPVDCVIGGSPCQDLSIAGKREGLSGARSGLFMEQIRIVKEMREADEHRGRTGQFIRPRYMVWENVPGAFSSNKGEDFRAVLEETIRIAEPEAPDIPLPPKGKWPLADAYYGDGWSVAYRVLDAQFWGVPQRRRRIALVADFGGHTAPEILFVRKGCDWNSSESGEAREGTSESTEGCTDKTGLPLMCIQGNMVDRDAKMNGSGVSDGPMFTLNATDRHSVFDARGNGDGQTACTITGDHENRVTDYTAVVCTNTYQKVTGSLCANSHPGSYTGQDVYNDMLVTHTLRGKANDPFHADMATYPIKNGHVRRLTPLECERLQGFHDNWTLIGDPEEIVVTDYKYKYDADGNAIDKIEIGQHKEIAYYYIDENGKRKLCSDAARYKALGNGIALPPWTWVLKRICSHYERSATMASLFDGIGGFPLIWERLNGAGTCLWASEIDSFCVAVTKRRFGDE